MNQGLAVIMAIMIPDTCVLWTVSEGAQVIAMPVMMAHTYIHTHIHSDSINTEGPLFYYYVFTSMHRVSLFCLEVK